MPKFFLVYTFVFLIKFCNCQIVGGNLQSSSDNYVVYGGITFFFTSISGVTTYFNIKKLHKYDKYRSNAIVGTLLGASQTALGTAIVFSKYDSNYDPIFGSINIASGLTVLTTSIIRLATKNPPKENKIAFNFLYVPSIASNSGCIGLYLSKKF